MALQYIFFSFFYVALQPNAGCGLLIHQEYLLLVKAAGT
jgi:hypothetical protein